MKKDKKPNVDKPRIFKVGKLSREKAPDNNRRNFLKNSIKAGALLGGVSTSLTSCAGDDDSSSEKSSECTNTYYPAHTSDILSVDINSTGTRIVTAGSDNECKVWNASTGELNLTYAGHQRGVNSVCFSPDDTKIASASDDDTVQVWEASTGNLLITYEGHTDDVKSVAFSPDGSKIASASSDGTVKVWESDSGTELLTFEGDDFTSYTTVCFSPDGTKVLSAENGDIYVWDASSGSQILKYQEHVTSSYINEIVISPDGTLVASSQFYEGVHVWRLTDGTKLYEFSFQDTGAGAKSLAFNSDSTRLAAGRYELQIRNATTGELLNTFFEGEEWEAINGMAFKPDSMQLVMSRADYAVIWDSDSAERIIQFYDSDLPSVISNSTSCNSGESTSWCICNTVCTCDEVCTCEGVGSGTDHYWYYA